MADFYKSTSFLFIFLNLKHGYAEWVGFPVYLADHSEPGHLQMWPAVSVTSYIL